MEQGRIPNIKLPQSWTADWEIDSLLGSGAYSSVYRAVRRDHPGIDAAIKIITIPISETETDTLRSEGFTADQSQSYYDDVARQYISEIEMMEELKGTQHIVGIEDYKVVRRTDTIGNYIFIRMELLTPLETLMRQRTLTEQEVLRVGIDICSALEFCAARNILHRDIKPANIFINDKTPGYVFYKLGDFGVARSLQSLTHGLSTKGTPNYMAPEVFTGKPYDQRADLYSLGITLYRLMNDNCLPFTSKKDLSISSREGAVARRMGGEKLPPPSRGSEAACRAILKACEFTPEDRYANASEMKAALESVLYQRQGSPSESHKPQPSSVPDRTKSSSRLPQKEKSTPKAGKKERSLFAVAAVCALAAIGILLYGLVLRPASDPSSTPTVLPTEEITPTPTATATTSADPTDTPTPSPTPTIQPTSFPQVLPGETNAEVMSAVQVALYNKGYYEGITTHYVPGCLDEPTAEAIRRFCETMHIAYNPSDGITLPLYSTMISESAPVYVAPTPTPTATPTPTPTPTPTAPPTPTPDPVKKEYYDTGELKQETEYDAQGREVSVSKYKKTGKKYYYKTADAYDPAGNPEKYTVYFYNSQGKYAKRTFSATYDNSGNEITNTCWLSDGTLYYYTEYAYDGNGNTTHWERYDMHGGVCEQKCTTEYSSSGKLAKQKYEYPLTLNAYYSEYDQNGNETKSVSLNSNGMVTNTTVYEYDSTGRQTGSVSYDKYNHINGKSVVTYNADGSREETHYNNRGKKNYGSVYDADGNYCWYISYNSQTGLVDSRSEYQYNSYKDTVKCTEYDADGKTKSWEVYEYNADGEQIKRTTYTAAGAVESYETMRYSPRGDIILSERFYANGSLSRREEYSEYGVILADVSYDENGQKNYENEYDQYGRRKKYTNYSDNAVSSVTYYENENKTRKLDYADNELKYETLYETNVFGDVTKETRYMFGTLYSVEYYRDGAWEGYLEENYKDGILDNYYEREFDDFGDRVKVTKYDAAGVVQYIEYYKDGNYRSYRSEYYKDGKLDYYYVTEFDSNGDRIKNTQYDASNVVKRIEYYRDGSYRSYKEEYYKNGKLDYYYAREFDSDGNVIKNTKYDASNTVQEISFYRDGSYSAYREEYYKNGRLDYYNVYEFNAEGSRTKRTQYDANGKILKTYDY